MNLSNLPIYHGYKTCTARKIYRSKVGLNGSINPVLYLLTTINDNSTTVYSDSIPDSSLITLPDTPDGSVVIGYNAKAYRSGDLIIANDTTSNPLIYGNFSDKKLVVNGSLSYSADTANSDSYKLVYPTLYGTLNVGQLVIFKALTPNIGACTLTINNGSAIPLKVFHDQDPLDNYIEAGSIIMVIYDGTNWQIQTPSAN